jgi:hypothetical protein
LEGRGAGEDFFRTKDFSLQEGEEVLKVVFARGLEGRREEENIFFSDRGFFYKGK